MGMAPEMCFQRAISLKPFAALRCGTHEIELLDVALQVGLEVVSGNAPVETAGPMARVTLVVQVVLHVLLQFVPHFEPFVTSGPIAGERPLR